jgi:hypothetical protein
MPAVHPERLAEEVKQVQGLINRPKKLRWRVVDILEFYADRTRRSKAALRRGHADKKFGVPRPVLYALERGLKQSVLEHPEQGVAISEELWRTDFHETRYLAITLLEYRALEELLSTAETWALEIDDHKLLEKLAQTLASLWKIKNYSDFPRISKKWLQEGPIAIKNFALITFRCAVDDPSFLDLPLIFRIIKDDEVVRNNKLKRVLHDLLRSLIQRSEPEAAHFLLDIIERDPTIGRKFIRALLECFSPDQQSRLKNALST